MKKGTILKGIGGFYYIATDQGVYECRARGIFRKNKITPVVGDTVQIEILDEVNKKGSLDVIEKRRNELIRPRVANVDQAVIVFAAACPEMNLDLLDRFLILAEEQNLEILICINKIDLDEKESYLEIEKLYQKAGYKVLSISTTERIGLQELKKALENKISVFAGPSGVGKSSIVNAIAPELDCSTGELSLKINRGKHTTRHAELMELFKHSYIVDSPGFTSLYLDYIPQEELKHYFREFEQYENQCKYHGCSHTHEPDCMVKNNIGDTISEMRYHRYLSIYQELGKGRKR